MDGTYRAITQGLGEQDWVVVDERGRIVFQGLAYCAARMAARLNRV